MPKAINNRHQKLLQLLEEKKALKISNLAHLMRYSESTVRRDINYLKQKIPIKIENGIAILIKNDLVEIDASLKSDMHSKEKKKIAKLALDFIEDYGTIYLDSSSTNTVFSTFFNQKKNLTVFTNNFLTALNVTGGYSSHKAYLLGGEIFKGICGGDLAENNLKDIFVDTAFISCRGIDIDAGVTEVVESEAGIKKLLPLHAREIILLVDDKKFDQKFTFKSIDLKNLKAMVTNQVPNENYMKYFNSIDVEVVY